MKTTNLWTGVVTLVAVLGMAHVVQGIDLKLIANVGNPASNTTYDPCQSGVSGCVPDSPDALGDVDYVYQIGKFEVTVPQYIEFLNAVGAEDINGLYHARMTTEPPGGINRNGDSGSYTYSLKSSAFANKPATHIRYYQAVRFANWMHNGKPSGAQDVNTTEDGSYNIAGANDLTETLLLRESDATWVLPNRDEFVKAAYHGIGAGGSYGADYFDYATGSNSAPATLTVDANGDVSNSETANIANLWCGPSGPCNWNGTTAGNVTNVGGPGTNSESFYGIANAQSNMSEWIESISHIDASHRTKTKNNWGSGTAADLGSAFGSSGNLTSSSNPREDEGFRLVFIPEPATLALMGLGGLMVLRRRH